MPCQRVNPSLLPPLPLLHRHLCCRSDGATMSTEGDTYVDQWERLIDAPVQPKADSMG
jgi:hypothetical protein